MSDDDQIIDDEPEPQDNPNLRVLREKAKRADALEAQLAEQAGQLATLQRENAFRSAGIDPAAPTAKYFVKAYDGELDTAAIRAEAEAAGIIAPPEAPAPDVSGFERFAQAAAGADAGGQPSTHWDELRDGMSPEQIAEVLVRHGQPVSDQGPVPGGFQPMMR